MALFSNWFGGKKTTGKVTQFAERDNSGDWLMYFNQFKDSIGDIERFSNSDAYTLANTIAEIYFPIDYIADACASLEFNVVNEGDLSIVEKLPKNTQRLIEKPNPYHKFSDLVYLGIFSKLADGNVYDYAKIPSSYKNINQDNITNIWTLQPNVTYPILKRNISDPFGIKDAKELIEYYTTFFFDKIDIDPKHILHHVLLNVNSNGRGESPLRAVEKNINNLIQVYSARYNVYAKNMNGGIISYEGAKSSDISMQLGDTVSRDQMVKDIQGRNGLTGNRNFIGYTNIPIKFHKTMATIKELEPFEEAEADAVAIASVFGLPSSLVPKRSEPKYSNAEVSEKKVWQDVIKSMAIERGKELSFIYQLPEGQTFYPDFSNVEVLQEDKKTALESDALLLDNLSKMKAESLDVTEAFEKLKDKYNSLDI